MDDFGNIIYIIITIVAFAISIFGRKKKNQAPMSSPDYKEVTPENQQRPFFSNIEKLLKEEMGIQNQTSYHNDLYEDYDEEPEPEPVQQLIAKDVLDTVPPEMLDSKEKTPYSIEFDDNNLIQTSSIEDFDLTRKDNEKYSVLDEFDIRKAVIYSEILKRKEY